MQLKMMEVVNTKVLDVLACNYNPEATEDDGSCEYITPVDLGEDIETCEESVTLDAGEGCDSYSWNGATYTQSGTYSSNTGSNNNYSMSFDGVDDRMICWNFKQVS